MSDVTDEMPVTDDDGAPVSFGEALTTTFYGRDTVERQRRAIARAVEVAEAEHQAALARIARGEADAVARAEHRAALRAARRTAAAAKATQERALAWLFVLLAPVLPGALAVVAWAMSTGRVFQ